MKKNAFSLVELLMLVTIIVLLFSFLLPSFFRTKVKFDEMNAEKLTRTTIELKPVELKVGDVVYVESLYITGKVNMINYVIIGSSANILTIGTQGPILLNNIDLRLLKKLD